MILNLHFENFRSFKKPVDLSLVAEGSKSKEQNVVLQRINKGTSEEEERVLKAAVLYGANASGKSNLIRGVQDILHFVCDTRVTAGESIEAYTPFLFDTTTSQQPVIFSIDFVGKDDVRFKYEISFGLNSVTKESLIWWPQGKPVTLLQRDIKQTDQELIHKVNFKSNQKSYELDLFQNQAALSKFGSEEADEIISSVFLYFTKIGAATPLQLSNSRSYRDRQGLRLSSDENLMKKLNELLRFADTGLKNLKVSRMEIDSRFIGTFSNSAAPMKDVFYDISATHPMFQDGKLLTQEATLPLAEESNGVRTLFTFGARILETLQEGGAIFVDELETSLHPYLSKLLVLLFQSERINKKKAQLIFTTHNTNLLDRTIFRKDQVWFAEKDEFGVTDLYSLQDFPDVREDTPFDKWYLAGKFGGIPDIKSIESLFEEFDGC